MRVIAGRLGGRNFQSPRGHRTHPMSDKIRGAVFNMLGDIDGLTVLDAYAGSGALSYEAISRGAARSLAVDVDVNACRTILENIRELELGARIKVVRQNISSWTAAHGADSYDIVLADPPYDDVKPAVIQSLLTHVKPSGVLVVSWPGKTESPVIQNADCVAQKNYGDATILIFRPDISR